MSDPTVQSAIVGTTAVIAEVPAQSVVVTPAPAPHLQSQALDPSVPAKTTFQEDLTTAGQRQVNLIWERTQSLIAIAVVAITMVASVMGMLRDLMIPNLIAVAFGTVIGFYFSRTNHAAIGGVGGKANETQEYRGR